MSTDAITPTRAIGFLHFHGRDLLIVRHESIEYTEAKPLSDTCDLFWKATKRTLSTDENVRFYGSCTFKGPEIGDFGTTSGPKTSLYLRLDRVHMFITRINTAHIRAKGKHATADVILALQHEWADALYAYETHGIAVKGGQRNALRELAQTARAIEQVRDSHTRQMLSAALHDELTALGLPADTLDDTQLPLHLPEGA